MSGRKRKKKSPYPILYWSHSSLLAYLRNPLAWYKRYVKKIYDTPRTPSSIIGSAGHVALEHFYSGVPKETAILLGLEYMRSIPDFEVAFGKAVSVRAKKKKRLHMEQDYLQAVNHYLERPPRHRVLGVEVKGMAKIPRVALPIKAVSDLVVHSKEKRGALDIVDHKFVDTYSSARESKPAFVLQAIFNYYTVRAYYEKPVHRFIVYECKKSKNKDGSPQLRRYVLRYEELREMFALFERLLKDATVEISRRKTFLPNPSDMFEGDHSFELYRLGLLDD